MRFLNFAPVTTITLAAIVAASLAIGATLLATSGPWLGVVFDRSYVGKGVRIERVVDGSPAAGKLRAGDIINALATPTLGRVEVFSTAVMEDPDLLSSYAEYNAFFAQQQTIFEAISSRGLTVVLSDESRWELTPAVHPGAEVLPATFWWLIFFGGASFLLGISAWSMRRESVTRVLAVSGMGFLVGSYCCAIYIARELALPSSLFFALTSANHLGIMVFGYATILFFWYYPKKLGDRPAAWVFFIAVAVVWLNETVQWLSWPGHVFYAHFVAAYILIILFALKQWQKSRGAPLQRAMLKWLLSTMLLCLGFTIVMFYLPIMLTGKSIASTTITFGAVFALYVSLIIGNIRYRQFDMEHWWISAWQWLLFICIALLADVLFVYFLHLNNSLSSGLAIGVGGVYLLARHWFWKRFSGRYDDALARALPHLVDALTLRQQTVAPDMQWQQLIARVFNPLSVEVIPAKLDNINIEQAGLALHLPSLDGTNTIKTFCCERGKRLFGYRDVNLAQRLLDLMRHSQDVLMAHDQGMLEERQRIQRDLHDDVAARLLSLLHQTREPAINRVARNALRGLRDVIHLLGAEAARLSDVASDIEAGAREQLAGLGVYLDWHSPDEWPEVMLNTQQHINLRRIAREVVANALKHAHPENIRIQMGLEGAMLDLCISNDGLISEPAGWVANRGLNNIKSRVAELDGSHEWGIDREGIKPRYCHLAVRIPLSPHDRH